ncbi:hypothetical protein CLOM_g23160 [Closterium sp. NIES-68]|nr:hypothetical protein CLOM_g23160 [Closterium sp. NIES-68]GJP66426.1 hypothetical protein CLOP_g23361 [Closterium sp. NIES-67]
MRHLAHQALERAANATNLDASGFQAAATQQKRPLRIGDVELQQQQGDVGFVCSRAWKQGLLDRVPGSRYLTRAFRKERISLESVAAGADSVCKNVAEIERLLANGYTDASGTSNSSSSSSLSGPDSPCNHWPESCWPVPGMPFSKLSDFGRRKYLVFAAVEEQLTNAKIHVIEAARVARETGRILVLPKGGHSHLAVGRPMPMCAYCDLAHLNSTEWVSPEFFLLVARAAFANPSVGYLCVDTPELGRPCFGTEEIAGSLGAVFTLAMGHVPTKDNTIWLHMPARFDQIQSLLDAWKHRDVVIYAKNTWERYERETDDVSHIILPYAREWHLAAKSMAAKLPKPYIGVHFRSEFIAFRLAGENRTDIPVEERLKILKERTEWCTREAVQKINKVKKRLNATTVFLAADIPYNQSGVKPRSESWNTLKWAFGDNNVSDVPHYWLSWLRSKVRGTVMIDELMPSANSLDPGVVAILDKLICARSNVFLAGSISCGGGRGFEKDILLHRDNLSNRKLDFVRWAAGEKPF